MSKKTYIDFGGDWAWIAAVLVCSGLYFGGGKAIINYLKERDAIKAGLVQQVDQESGKVIWVKP